MLCFFCYNAAQQLSANKRKNTRNVFTLHSTRKVFARGRVKHKKMEMKRWDGEKEGERILKMNGRAERTASKLYNECLSLASMMDESGMVFVTIATFLNRLLFLGLERGFVSCVEPATVLPYSCH